jgi:hypothetical protein
MNRIAIAFLVLAVPSAPAFADANYTYLALGDSVPFGMNVTLLAPYSQQTPTPEDFIGYPETVAAAVRVSEVNASCPGETSGSFLNTAVPDNGCNSPHVVPLPSPALRPVIIPPFKTTIGLHTAYTSAQMDFAVSQLKASNSIDLVTLSIGANDILLVLPQLEECGTDPACAQKILGPVLQICAMNLGEILARIRA